jgi:hypothetical protein
VPLVVRAVMAEVAEVAEVPKCRSAADVLPMCDW